jgi:hypothetical protein
MDLGKFDKLVYVGCPWLFGVVLVVGGIFAANISRQKIAYLILICAGLICISLYCVCALLLKLIEKK